MVVSQLNVNTFRNFFNLNLNFHPKLNLFYGENGSGKTSLLESLYYTSHAKSFRTHINKRIIQNQQDKFILFSKIIDCNNYEYSIGIEKDVYGNGTLKLSGQPCPVFEITSLLPIQILNNDSFFLLNSGPKIRRQFLDWGIFYQNPNFLPLWRNYQRTLKQRNLSIKQKLSNSEINNWNYLLASSANKLSKLRDCYSGEFIGVFYKLISNIFNFNNLMMRFYQGWPLEQDLSELLCNNFLKDFELGYTFYGAHRADLKISLNKSPIQDILSRGQQKIFVWLMKIAQALLLKEQKPVILIDDIGSELDETRLKLFCEIFQSIDGQLFITAISKEHLKFFSEYFSDYYMFHVKHNEVVREK